MKKLSKTLLGLAMAVACASTIAGTVAFADTTTTPVNHIDKDYAQSAYALVETGSNSTTITADRNSQVSYHIQGTGAAAKFKIGALTYAGTNNYANNSIEFDVRSTMKGAYVVLAYNNEGTAETISKAVYFLQNNAYTSVAEQYPADSNWYHVSIPFSELSSGTMVSKLDKLQTMTYVFINTSADTTKDMYIDNLDIKYTETEEATCTEDGRKVVYSNFAHAIESDTVLLKHHSYTVTDSEEATCEEAGYITYKCSKCDKKETYEIPALGHDWSDWYVVTEATSEHDGEKNRICMHCFEVEEKEYSYTIIEATKTFAQEKKDDISATWEKIKSIFSSDEEAKADAKDNFNGSDWITVIITLALAAGATVLIVKAGKWVTKFFFGRRH